MQPSPTSTWYDELREEYRPRQLKWLLIAESPPDPGAGRRRFFYAPDLTRDNLYRGVADAVYGLEPSFDIREKAMVLRRLQSDGCWLIDAVAYPINKLPGAERRRAIADGVPRLVDRCSELRPTAGAIICHARVFDAAAPALADAGIRVLHSTAIPFPLGNWRKRFVDQMREALAAGS